MPAPGDTSAAFARFLRERHRPNHARRSAGGWAGFVLPHLRPGMALLDVGCGPASITVGLADAITPGGTAVGVDLAPERLEGWPAGSGPAARPVLAAGDGQRLPFPAGTFDAVFCCALLQHVRHPAAVLRECRRVARPGAVVGLADADWGGAVQAPADPWLVRGQEVMERLRAGTSPHVGRDLRRLLHDAGFVRASAQVRGHAMGTPEAVAGRARSEVAFFTAPAVVDHVIALGIADRRDMAAIADAWRRWGEDPGAVAAGFWFEALAWAPG